MGEATWFWFAYVAVGVLLIYLAWYGGRRRRLNPVEIAAADDVVCRQCGYDVRGLPGAICPECGSDLDVVGRLTARFRKWQKTPPAIRAIVWTAAVGLIAIGSMAFAVLNYMPARMTLRSTSNIGTAPPLVRIEEVFVTTEKSIGMAEAWVDARMNYGPVAHTVVVTPPLKNTPLLAWDRLADSWSLQGVAVPMRGSGPPTPEAINAFVTALMGSPATQPAQAEVSDDVQPWTLGATLPMTPERLRLVLLSELKPLNSSFGHTREQREEILARLEHGSGNAQAAMDATLGALPAGWFEGTYREYSALLAAPQAGGWGHRAWPEPLPASLASAWWLVVWAVGLRFVLRRRPVRGVMHVQEMTDVAAT